MDNHLKKGDIVGGRYLIERSLSQRIPSNMYLAVKIENSIRVVLRGAENIEQLENEWQALNACRGHDIQTPLDSYIRQGFIVLSFYSEAESLLSLELEQTPLFVSLIPAIIRAISRCHEAGWVHGDIKPSNVLYLPSSNRLKLVDFGAALPIGKEREELVSWEMSNNFSSPQQRVGKGVVSPNDDWYALARWLEQLDKTAMSKKDYLQLQGYRTWLSNKLA